MGMRSHKGHEASTRHMQGGTKQVPDSYKGYKVGMRPLQGVQHRCKTSTIGMR